MYHSHVIEDIGAHVKHVEVSNRIIFTLRWVLDVLHGVSEEYHFFEEAEGHCQDAESLKAKPAVFRELLRLQNPI
jgi:hypothetical protein